jgi:hypothetical protein
MVKDNKEVTRRQTWRRENKIRPRISWMDDVEQDVTNMGVKRCKTRSLDGTERASLARVSQTDFKKAEVLKREKMRGIIST